MEALKTISQGLNAILFPSACPCCGDIQADEQRLLCPFCSEHAFDVANPQRLDTCSVEILPEFIRFQDAMWKYDKYGSLQELIIRLKYQGMAKLGMQLGTLLGYYLVENPAFREQETYVLIPVPLHPARKRKRGYNQARSIAEGVSRVTGISIINENAITRIRNTPTQTGLNYNKRMRNIRRAFKVNNPEGLNGCTPIIIDDVFTTGSTTFELAVTLKPHSGHDMGILTVALV